MADPDFHQSLLVAPGVTPVAPTLGEAEGASPGPRRSLGPKGSLKPGGSTTIADAVVAKIVSLTARQVDGVDSLGGALSGALSGVVGRIRGDEHRTAGVGVEVGRRQVAIDLSVTLRYPYPVRGVTGQIRQAVVSQVERLTGLEVVEVNVVVTDLAFVGEAGLFAAGARDRIE